MKNKTPLQELLAAINDLPASALAIYQWTEANKARLLEAERNMVALAYVAGEDLDWGYEPSDLDGDEDEILKRGTNTLTVAMARNKYWFLGGIGINYLLINFPFVMFCKYGYTGLNVGTKKRAAAINRAMPGIPIPVFFVVTFFAFDIEQWVHRNARMLKARFYKGDGSSETYWVVAVPFFLFIMLAIWCIYIIAFDAYFHTTILPTVAGFVYEFFISIT